MIGEQMKVLIIFDLIPEETKRAIVEMTDIEYEYFKPAHNFIVNSDAGDGYDQTMVVNWAFADKGDTCDCDTDKEREYRGKWKDTLDVTDLSDVTHLIHCGFYL